MADNNERNTGEATVTVRIAYSPNKYEVGKVRQVTADEAKVLIREGRAARVAEGDLTDADREARAGTHTGPPPADDAPSAGPADATIEAGSRTGRRRVTTTSTPSSSSTPPVGNNPTI